MLNPDNEILELMVLLDSHTIQRAYSYTYEELISRSYCSDTISLKHVIKQLMIVHRLISKKMQELFFSQK